MFALSPSAPPLHRPRLLPRGNQLTRQWRLLQLIDRPAGVAVDDAARELDCAVRTIWRDLQVLQAAGFPIYDDRHRRPPLHLARRRHLQAPAPSQPHPGRAGRAPHEPRPAGPAGAGILGPAIESAFDKIASILSKDALGLIDRIRDTIGVRAVGAKLQAPAAEHVAAIQRALMGVGGCTCATTP